MMNDRGSNSALWDQRRAKAKGNIGAIPRTCIKCRRDATPRYLYCSDACARLSLAENIAALLKSKGGAA